MLGNGSCDSECNNADCNYDSGDCGCSPGCTYGKEDCSNACTVLACDYSSGRNQCTEAYQRATGRYFNVLENDFTAIFSYDDCIEASPSCTTAILQGNYDGSSCDQQSCNTSQCALGLGCSSSQHSCPAHCLQCTSTGECLRCDESYYNYAADCVQECPSGYSKLNVDGDRLCIDSQLATDYLIVDPASTGLGVYSTLYEAMSKVTSERTVIYLVQGSHNFEVPADLVVDEAKKLDPLYQTALKKSLTIKPAYCSEVSTPHCVDDSSRPVVTVLDSRIQIKNYFSRFEVNSLEFEGAFALDKSCSESYCQYCPYYEIKSDKAFIDDRKKIYDLALLTDGQWKTSCDDYHQTDLISSVTVQSGSFRIINCVFANLRQELKSVIRVTKVKVVIEASTFTNIVANVAAVYIGEGAEAVFTDMTVKLLNNGFEYRSSISQAPFLVLEETFAVRFVDCLFTMNLVLKGPDAFDGTWTSSLIHIKNFKETIQLKGCTFTHNIASEALILLDVTTLTYHQTYTDNILDQLTWTHLDIVACTFSYNGGQYIIYHNMDSWPHNSKVTDSSFTHNYFYISMIFIGKVNMEDYSENGGQKTLEIKGKKNIVVFSPQFAIFERVTLSNNDANVALVFLFVTANAKLKEITSIDNGNSQLTFFEAIMTPIINDSETYLSKASPSPYENASCEMMYRISYGSRLTLTHSTFTNDRCIDGTGGIGVINDYGDLSFSYLSFDRLQSGMTYGGALSINDSQGSITIGPQVNIQYCQNSKGPAGIGIVGADEAITYTDSYCISNTGALGVCGLITNVSKVTIMSVTAQYNTATSGSGGAFYISTTFSESPKLFLSVISCSFTGNSAGAKHGGALYLSSTDAATNLSLLIESTPFKANSSKLHGSAVYISSTFELNDDSLIDSCSFIDNLAEKDAALMMLYSSGKLTIQNTPFKGNTGVSSVSSIYALFNSDGVTLAIIDCEISENQGIMAVLISSTGVGNKLTTESLNLHDNNSVGIIIEACIWTDFTSTIYRNYSGGVQITRTAATLTRTRIFSNSSISSGGGIRVNNLSHFTCNDCEVSHNSSNNNGGAIMSESESAIDLVNCNISHNTSQGSGSAVYIISSTLTSRLVNVIIIGNISNSTGAIQMLDAKLTIEGSTIGENTAAVGTPGVSANSSTLIVIRSKFYSQT